ncbi:MAG: dockerin type I domain-containing protein [Oscillospiraceae bacterium]|nr:dockerin type I domain-containing protein [Oscillospiraceae bacterium]
MKKRGLSAAIAVIAAFSMVESAMPVMGAESANSIKIAVDVSAGHQEISPYIYGINDSGHLDQVNVNAVRQGGNRYSAYNWENNYSNAGSDWKHNSDTYLVNGYSKERAAEPAACALTLSDECVKHNIPYKIATIQMAGYVSADADGPVTEKESAPSARWKEVKAAKNAPFAATPDLTDDYVYMDEYVNYLVSKLGDASTASGINAYNLDNEPSLWSSTHELMHPNKTTYKEMTDKSIEFASAIKAVDPKAEVFGLALFGFGAYLQLNQAPDADSSYNWFLSYYLDQMAKAEKENGKRLIDVIDVHYYSEATGDKRVTDNTASSAADIKARLQAPRTLYEEGFKEKSWIADSFSSYLPILPNIQKSIDTYYPGTKLAITEYNFGGGDHISGAIAQADTLGIFAKNNVYVATLWPLSSNIDYQLAAIDLYTNYDGEGSSFGNTLVEAASSDTEVSNVYASINDNDESKVTMVLTNKDTDNAKTATIQIAGNASYKSAAVYGLTEESSSIQLMGVEENIKDNTFTVTLPAMSVVQIEVSADDFVLMGDVNNDKAFEMSDLVLMQKYLLGIEALKNPAAGDMDSNKRINATDLSMMKEKMLRTYVPAEFELEYKEINTATWKTSDTAAGKTITCTIGAKPGYSTSWGYGYWDNDAAEWIQGDDTSIGNFTVNAKGEATFSFDAPENATSLQVQCYYYATYDAALGENVEEDLANVEMKSMTFHY